jgi:glycosyltransferase involved in cell wall biosynthesis
MNADNPVKISAVIITKNEERNIARCLNSLKEIADEIVILDSGSTDNTVSISESLGAKVFMHPFDGHIEQKNRAITFASYPHILSLDADEALDEQLKTEILKLKSSFNAEGYTMNRLTNYCGHWVKYCGWYPDKKLRLWDSRKGKWGGTNPHDRYELSSESKIVHLKGNILHYSYYSISDHLRQVDYFTEIAAKASFREGKQSSLIKILFAPPFKFFRDYVFKAGFLDGYYGFVICKISAFATFSKYTKLRALQKESTQKL